MKIDNIYVFDLENSLKASKYPKSIDTANCSSELTETIMKLASCPPGTGHDQFLTGITVNFDLTCSNKMWVELQRYTFVNFVSSQSTMHKINNFDINAQCNEFVDETIKNRLIELQKQYAENKTNENFYKLIYNIPSGFNLTARLTTNYRALKTIYHQRKHHRLPEWNIFCSFIEKLPYAKELIIGGEIDYDGQSESPTTL